MDAHLEKALSLLFIYKEGKKSTELCDTFKLCFKELHFCSSVEEAFDLYESEHCDLILMDLFLENGLEFIKKIRTNNQRRPLILLNKNLKKSELEELLTLHISGFISSKSSADEIIHSIHQIVRKSSGSMEEIGNMFYCYGTKSLTSNTTKINLTHHENLLLELLLSRRGYLVYYAEIEYEIWQDRQMSADALKTLVKKLRKKLPPEQLENVASEGYRLKQ